MLSFCNEPSARVRAPASRRAGPGERDLRGIRVQSPVNVLSALRISAPSKPSRKDGISTMTDQGAPRITGGVDTHKDVHVAAALDAIGTLLGTASFPMTAAGYRALEQWLAGFGPVAD